MRPKIVTIIMTLAAALFFAAHTNAVAGTTIIKVVEESGGIVNDTVNNTQNPNGALFWNGTDWMVNDTYSHKYFTDLVTGDRLKLYTTYEINSSQNPAAPGTLHRCKTNLYLFRSWQNRQSQHLYLRGG